MSRRSTAVLLACLSCAALGPSAPAFGQTQPGVSQPGVAPPNITPPNGIPQPGFFTAENPRSRAIRDAQQLIRAGKFEEALARLDGVPIDPAKGDPEIVVMRGTCLRRLGKMHDAEDLYRKEADAMTARGDDSTPMLVELERVYREERSPEKAFGVCLEIHRHGAGAAEWVLDEMESLIQADSLGERALPALRGEISRRPEASDLADLLVGALLFLGKPDEALVAARDLDKSRNAQGKVLLDHLLLLDKKGLGQPAIDAADAAVQAGLKGDDLQNALYLRAAALRRLRRFPEASSAYERAAQSEPNGPFARLALRDRADVLVRDMGDIAGGSSAYEALIAQLQKGAPIRDQGKLLGQALVALADCKLRLGRYDEAAAVLAKVEATAPDAETKEEAAFQQAEILFYSGKVDTAETAFNRVVQQYAGGVRVNDALSRILLLTRCSGAGAVPMAALGQIAYQRRNGSAQRILEICTTAEKACGDCAAAMDLLREESLALLDLGQINEATQRADTLAARYPLEAAAPELLLAVADRMRQRDGDSDGVIRRYEDLLARYPKSHEAFEVRPQLEKMRRNGSALVRNPKETQG